MTTKFKKMTAMLLVGVLACASLAGCNGSAYGVVEGDNEYNYDNDYNYNSSGGSNSGNTQQGAQYTGLSPTEVYQAVLSADDFTMSSHATLTEGGFHSILSYVKDNNAIKWENTQSDGDGGILYFDFDSQTMYSQNSLNGKWYADQEEYLTVSTFVMDLAGNSDCDVDFIEYIFKTSNYTKSSDMRYEMNSATLAKCKITSGYMTVSGVVYQFAVAAQREDGKKMNITITVDFNETSVSLPTVE